MNISFISTSCCPRLGHTPLPSSQPRGTSTQTSTGQSWGPPVGHTPTGSPTSSQGHGRVSAGQTPTSPFALSFIRTKGWAFTGTTVWAEPRAAKAADPELGEEQVRADSWSGQFKSPRPQWLRLVLNTEGCMEASAQPGSVRVCVCVCMCALVLCPLVNLPALRRGLVWVSSTPLH